MHHANSEWLTRILVEAARDAGVRVILAQNGSKIGSGLRGSDTVFTMRDYPIPHHVLFPRLKAAVHHGSWIATHLAAQAGIPQLVLPQASDQYLWANVVWKNALGPRGVDMNRMKSRKLSAAIEQLTQNPEYESNAQALAERVSGIDGAKNAVRLFEKLLQSRLPVKYRPSYADYPRSVGGAGRKRSWAQWSGAVRRRREVGSTAAVRKLERQDAGADLREERQRRSGRRQVMHAARHGAAGNLGVGGPGIVAGDPLRAVRVGEDVHASPAGRTTRRLSFMACLPPTP